MWVAPVSVRLALLLCLTAALGLALGGARLAAAQFPEDLRAAAVQLVAARTGLPPVRLVVVNLAEATFPTLGNVGVAVKVLDTRAGAVHTVTLDRNRRPLDPAQLLGRDRAQQSASGAPVDAPLAARLADAAAEQPVPVVFWLREPVWQRPARAAPARGGTAPQRPEVAPALEAALAASRAAAVGPLVAPLLARLSAAGTAPLTAGGAPAVYATAPAQLVAELSSWPEVERVYLGGVNRPDLDVARPTIGAAIVQARGLTGQNVQIAQIEPVGRFAAANPYLAGVVQDPTYACATESDHATQVAGILRSTHPTLRGIAPGSSLRVGGSCTGISAELNNRAAAAADWGARIFSLSYSNDTNRQPGPDDRFYDDLVFNAHRTVIKSAGNNGQTTGNVTSPGLGYNVLTVANFDDRNTLDWGDDAVNPTSGYLGPRSTHGDRRKPELAAPGTNIRTLSGAAPWDTALVTGASFATPMVAGSAALLFQRRPDLASWPEAVRAILLAAAVNPLAGDPALSSRGGVGGLSADRADDLVQRVNGDWGAQAYGCDAPSPLNVATVAATAGQRVRAVAAWNTDPGWAGWPAQPGADLDLVALSPFGDPVGVSASLDNSYEVVEFVATQTGDYRLQVSLGRCDSSPTGLAWAWYNASAPAATPTPTITPTPRPPTATATPTVPPTLTPTPTVPPACGPPRPHVAVSVTRGGGGLVVGVATETLPGSATNTIAALRFGAATNALIDVGGVAGRTGSFTVTLAPAATRTTFVVRQATSGRAATVPLTIVDGCGEWPTLVGGGPEAF